jgi:hypothetical protein
LAIVCEQNPPEPAAGTEIIDIRALQKAKLGDCLVNLPSCGQHAGQNASHPDITGMIIEQRA